MKLSRATAASLALVCAAGVAGVGQTLTLGQTFPIAEPDVLAEIQERVAKADVEGAMKRRPLEQHSAFQSVGLPYAKQPRERVFDPTYTLPQAITDAQGKVIYPAGTKINVYARMTMPGRVVVIGPEPAHYRWLREVVKPTERDVVLLAGGNPYQVRQSEELPVFILDERMVERFGLEAAPAVVSQQGVMLKVAEYAVPLD